MRNYALAVCSTHTAETSVLPAPHVQGAVVPGKPTGCCGITNAGAGVLYGDQ